MFVSFRSFLSYSQLSGSLKSFPHTVLQYFTKSGIKVTIRPSGTEPKLKFYVEVPCDTFRSADDYAQACRYTASVKDRIVAELAQILQDNHFEMK